LKNIVLGFLLLTVLPTAASAGDLDYSYLQFGLSQNQLTGGYSGTGFAVSGSGGLPLGFFLDGSFEDTDFGNGGSTMRRITAHAGWHVGVLDSLDLGFRLGSTNVASDYGYSRTGKDWNVGLRAQLPAGFEVEADWGNAGAAFATFACYYLCGGANPAPVDTTERYESAALRYHLTDRILLGLSYRKGTSHPSFAGGDTSTLSTWLLALRVTF
jgi:hypothetical protein